MQLLFEALIREQVCHNEIEIVPSENIFDEELTLRHGVDFVGDPRFDLDGDGSGDDLVFEWWRHPAPRPDPGEFPDDPDPSPLWQQFRGAGHAAGKPDVRSDTGLGAGAFAVTLGNSGDSLALFLPLMSESNREALLLIVAVYLLLILLWALLSLAIAGHPLIARRLERQGARVVPWIMICVGLYILMDTGTDTLV